MTPPNRSIAVAVVLMICTAAPAFADGVIRDSIGAASSGRGGTNIGHFDNGAVLLSNPAAIVNAPGNGLFELSVDSLLTDLDYFDSQNSTNARNRLFPLPEISYIYKDRGNQWAAGIGIFVPAGFGAHWNMQAPPPIPGQTAYKSLGVLTKIIPGFAYRVTDRLSVGATLGVGVNHLELEGPFTVQTGLLRGAPTQLDLQGTDATVTWSLGAQYLVSDRTTIGIAYTSEDRFTINDGIARATIYTPGGPITSNFDADIDIVWPRSLGVGVSHWFTDRHRSSLDVIWYDWSHAFDSLELKLTNPSHPALAGFTPIQDKFPLEWKDSISVRWGHEWFFTPCDVLRIGHVYNSQTIPSRTLTPYIPAILEHTVSLGYGKFWKNWRFDIAYQFGFGPKKRVDQSQIIGGDFDNSSLKAQAHWLNLGFTYSY